MPFIPNRVGSTLDPGTGGGVGMRPPSLELALQQIAELAPLGGAGGSSLAISLLPVMRAYGIDEYWKMLNALNPMEGRQRRMSASSVSDIKNHLLSRRKPGEEFTPSASGLQRKLSSGPALGQTIPLSNKGEPIHVGTRFGVNIADPKIPRDVPDTSAIAASVRSPLALSHEIGHGIDARIGGPSIKGIGRSSKEIMRSEVMAWRIAKAILPEKLWNDAEYKKVFGDYLKKYLKYSKGERVTPSEFKAADTIKVPNMPPATKAIQKLRTMYEEYKAAGGED